MNEEKQIISLHDDQEYSSLPTQTQQQQQQQQEKKLRHYHHAKKCLIMTSGLTLSRFRSTAMVSLLNTAAIVQRERSIRRTNHSNESVVP